jgi:hypothetical protein
LGHGVIGQSVFHKLLTVLFVYVGIDAFLRIVFKVDFHDPEYDGVFARSDNTYSELPAGKKALDKDGLPEGGPKRPAYEEQLLSGSYF